MIGKQPDKPSPLDDPAFVEHALDEALEETFPASDPINLGQWMQMSEEEHTAAREREAKTLDVEVDRRKTYLKGPTSFSA